MKKNPPKYKKPKIEVKKLEMKLLFIQDVMYDSLLSQGGCPCSCPLSCFLAGTKITTPEGYKNIEEIEKGSTVISFDTEKNLKVKTRIKEIIRDKSPSYHIFNDRIRVTGFHRFWQPEKKDWVMAHDLKIGENLLKEDGTFEEVKKIENVNEEVEIYNFHVEAAERNYFAQGVLVHNCKCEC